jgi:hypothetical protein
MSGVKLWLVFLLSVVCGAAQDTLDAFGFRWRVQNAKDWAVEGDSLRLLVAGEPPPGQPRRPQKYALAETEPFRTVTLEAEVRRDGRSLVLIYAWQDEAHYNYAHISSDPAEKVHVHNGMFHVFGGERVRISLLEGPPSLPRQEWTPVRLVFDGDSGRCIVEVNGRRNPSLEAVDLSLRFGRVGLGSFDETGSFRKIRIRGKTRPPSGIGRR